MKLVRVRHYLCSRNVYVSAINLCSRNFYVSAIICVQKTSMFPPLPVFEKRLMLANTFVQETCMCTPLPLFKKLVCVRQNLCSRNLYMSVITCVIETCTSPPLHAFKKHIHVCHFLCSKTCTCLTLPVSEKLRPPFRMHHTIFASDITCV